MQLRQGRSLRLPTLPYQKTNRYAVDGAKLVFYLLPLRISCPNHSVVVSVIPVFVLLSPRIGYTNRYAVVGTRPLIGAWAVMKYLLPRTLYIIRCVAVWNEMVFVGRTSNTQSYKPTLS